MVFYDNLGNPESEESITEKARQQREILRKNLERTLEEQKFTPREIDEVMGIIDAAEIEIQKIKDSLIGTNLNNEDPSDAVKIVEVARIKIHELEIKMGQDIKDKVAQIRASKA